MTSKITRKALFAMAAIAGAAALASPALAQTPPGPPVCGSVASLANVQLFLDGPGALGDNIVSIPAVSPINNNPAPGPQNGFPQLCQRFGLTGTGSSILQFNAQTGGTTTYLCNSLTNPFVWTPGQAALIRPVGVSGTISGRIPGVECSRPYRAYQFVLPRGQNLWPTPITLTDNLAVHMCTGAGFGGALADGSQVIQFNAQAGQIITTNCNSPYGSTNTFNIGQGVLIHATNVGGALFSPVIY